MVFCDTSTVAKLYVVETESKAVRALLEEADQRFVSDLVRVELMGVFTGNCARKFGVARNLMSQSDSSTPTT